MTSSTVPPVRQRSSQSEDRAYSSDTLRHHPVVHQPARPVGDAHRVEPVGLREHLVLVARGCSRNSSGLIAATIFTFSPALSSSGRILTMLAVVDGALDDHSAHRLLAGLVVADDVGALGRGEVGGHAQGLPVGDLDGRPGQVQGDDRRRLAQRRAQHHRHLVVLPGMQVDDVALGEQLGDARREDAEVGAGVLGGLRARVAGDPEHLAQLELAVLGHLADTAASGRSSGRRRSRRWRWRRRSPGTPRKGSRRSSPRPCRPSCRRWRTR